MDALLYHGLRGCGASHPLASALTGATSEAIVGELPVKDGRVDWNTLGLAAMPMLDF